jgi:hypothetical protein
MGSETRYGMIYNDYFNGSTHPFLHYDEEEGRKWIPLPYSYGGREIFRGETIE